MGLWVLAGCAVSNKHFLGLLAGLERPARSGCRKALGRLQAALALATGIGGTAKSAPTQMKNAFFWSPSGTGQGGPDPECCLRNERNPKIRARICPPGAPIPPPPPTPEARPKSPQRSWVWSPSLLPNGREVMSGAASLQSSYTGKLYPPSPF